MKRTLFAIMAVALAGGAMGETVVNSVRSSNLFGAVKVTGVASNMFVAVPFEGFDGNARQAKDVVNAANLTAGTKMFVYDKSEDKYDVYVVEDGAWKGADKATITADGKEMFGTSDLTRGVVAGTGAILVRENTDDAVYVYGQIPSATAGTQTFATGQTLICAPSTNAIQAVDLNSFTWTGVAATSSNRLKGKATADCVQFRDSQNRLVRYYYENGKWGVVPSQKTIFASLVADGKALVPAGTAFWYYSPTDGASVTW